MILFWSSRPEHTQRPPTDTAKRRFALIPTRRKWAFHVSPLGGGSIHPPLARGRSLLSRTHAHRTPTDRRHRDGLLLRAIGGKTRVQFLGQKMASDRCKLFGAGFCGLWEDSGDFSKKYSEIIPESPGSSSSPL